MDSQGMYVGLKSLADFWLVCPRSKSCEKWHKVGGPNRDMARETDF